MSTADTSVRSMLDVARELAPMVRHYADQTEQLRQLPRPLFEALADAGLFHMMVPRSIGGREVDLPTYIRVMEELGRADASTAWCVNQGGVYAIYSACVATRCRPRGLDRHAALGRREHRPAHLYRRVRPRRVPRERQGRLQHRLSARLVDGGTRPHPGRRPAEIAAERPDRDPLLPAPRGRDRDHRHLAHPRHARDGHQPLQRVRSLRARGAHLFGWRAPTRRARPAVCHPDRAALPLGRRCRRPRRRARRP